MQLKAMILAGGIGSRLWPISTNKQPKQFLKLFSGFSLFQLTILRNKFIGKPTILINQENLTIVTKQLQEIDCEADIIIESTRRGTAPSALLASIYAKQFGYKYIALIPSDHFIDDEDEYKKTILEASEIAKYKKLVTIGIEPNGFNPEYGYIETNTKYQNFYNVTKFKEKPKTEPEKIFSTNNHYYWNSGIYITNYEDILTYSHDLCPFTANLTRTAFDQAVHEDNHIIINDTYFKHTQPGAFDIVFTENINDIAMVKATFKWEDLGCWNSLFERMINGYNIGSHSINSCASDTSNQPDIVKSDNLVAVCHNNCFFVAKRSLQEKMLHFSKFDIIGRQIEQFSAPLQSTI